MSVAACCLAVDAASARRIVSHSIHSTFWCSLKEGMTAACAALKAAYEHIRAYGTTQGAPIASIPMSELHDLVGFPEIWDFERRFAETR